MIQTLYLRDRDRERGKNLNAGAGNQAREEQRGIKEEIDGTKGVKERRECDEKEEECVIAMKEGVCERKKN